MDHRPPDESLLLGCLVRVATYFLLIMVLVIVVSVAVCNQIVNLKGG